MKWRRRPEPAHVPGEYPESFVKGFMRQTLPSTTPERAAAAVRHLRRQGWSEEKLAEFILPYMPREPTTVSPAVPGSPNAPGATGYVEPASPGARGGPIAPGGPSALPLPPDVTRAWLDRHLPAMDRRQMRLVVDELERRGWPLGTVAVAVLPHLLPKLPDEDVQAITTGLTGLGMTDAEIAAATAPR